MVRQLEQLRPPVVAEVVMCVPINTILGSEVKREQSLGSRPLMMVRSVTVAKLIAFLRLPSHSRGQRAFRILAQETREEDRLSIKVLLIQKDPSLIPSARVAWLTTTYNSSSQEIQHLSPLWAFAFMHT